MKHPVLDNAHAEYNIARELLSEAYPNGDFTEVAYHLACAVRLNLESYLAQCNFSIPEERTLRNYITCAKVCGYSELTILISMQETFDSWLNRDKHDISYNIIDKGFDIFAFSYNYVMDFGR